MKIAIISDIHNNEVNLDKVLRFCTDQKVRSVICCGDLASRETLDFLCDHFPGPISYAFGNMDDEQLGDLKFAKYYKHAKLYSDHGEVAFSWKTVAFVHFPDAAQRLASSGRFDYVFYGHTHKPWTETVGHCVVLNPGNVAGEIYLPTFAIWNTDNGHFDLIRVHDLK